MYTQTHPHSVRIYSHLTRNDAVTIIRLCIDAPLKKSENEIREVSGFGFHLLLVERKDAKKETTELFYFA